MRTSLKYVVVRDDYGFNTIEDKGAVLTITLSKNDTFEMADNFISALNKLTGFNFFNGEWCDDYYQVGYIEMDRDDFESIKDDYRRLKADIKNGIVNLKEAAEQEEIIEEPIIEPDDPEMLTDEEIESVIEKAVEYNVTNNESIIDTIKIGSEMLVFNWCNYLINDSYVIGDSNLFKAFKKVYDRVSG